MAQEEAVVYVDVGIGDPGTIRISVRPVGTEKPLLRREVAVEKRIRRPHAATQKNMRGVDIRKIQDAVELIQIEYRITDIEMGVNEDIEHWQGRSEQARSLIKLALGIKPRDQ